MKNFLQVLLVGTILVGAGDGYSQFYVPGSDGSSNVNAVPDEAFQPVVSPIGSSSPSSLVAVTSPTETVVTLPGNLGTSGFTGEIPAGSTITVILETREQSSNSAYRSPGCTQMRNYGYAGARRRQAAGQDRTDQKEPRITHE